MKQRNPHAVGAHGRKAGPHDQPDDTPPVDRDPYTPELWAHEILERLRAGREEYGDTSFRFGPERLLHELEQEAEDLAGWGYVLVERLRGPDFEDTLSHAPGFLLASAYGTPWPPPESKTYHATAVWLARLSYAVKLHLDAVKRHNGG